jgi:hypothetical protein
VARCGWATVAVGCHLGCQLGYLRDHANSPECSRPEEAASHHDAPSANVPVTTSLSMGWNATGAVVPMRSKVALAGAQTHVGDV